VTEVERIGDEAAAAHADAVRARFAATAARLGELQDTRSSALSERISRFVSPAGDERALDAGTGVGALAFALAPLVREVVAVDLVPELLEEARRRAQRYPNVHFVEGDVTALDFPPDSFDLAGSLRTLHHVARPELAVAELTRVTRPGGRVLVVDQVAPVDPLAAIELNRFERARDPSHARALADIDLRHLFESNGLVLRTAEFDQERREVEWYLDLAGCEGEQRDQARALLPGGGDAYTAEVGWYLLAKPAA
jgi:ubiquinone/menaquinone biosynthesis C-methylase UbiE